MSGAPDPTFGSLHGDKSQWQLSLELLDKRLRNDLDSMIRMRSLFDFADRRQLVLFIYLFIYLLTICNKTLKTYFSIVKILAIGGLQEWSLPLLTAIHYI